MSVERIFCISPREAREQQERENIRPEEVYEAVNRFLVERYQEGENIKILRSELIDLIYHLMKRDYKSVSWKDFSDNPEWLGGIEDIYKTSGWVVERRVSKTVEDDIPTEYWLFKEFKPKAEDDLCRD